MWYKITLSFHSYINKHAKNYKRWGAQRIINLIGAWRNQLLEVLGAMGLREVRRLRGEVGRAIFFEDIEKEIFDKVFVKEGGVKS